MVRSVRIVWLAALIATAARDGVAQRELPDYRYFRALSLDLAGRPPTRAELADFERADFSLDAWIDTHLGGAAYAERLQRIYMDLLRLEVGPSFQFVPNAVVLRRQQIAGPDGAPIYIYFRRGQRRVDPAIDGDFCFTRDDTGLEFPVNSVGIGFPHPVTQALLDQRTVVVRPWWLYADYHSAVPSDAYGPEWARRFPGFTPAPLLGTNADGSKATAIRVCREEAQTADTGTVYASGRAPVKKGAPLPAGRLTQPPNDSPFAKANKGRAIGCASRLGFENSVECGCGIGLERCMPSAGAQNEAPAFVIAQHAPLGDALPFDATPQTQAAWERMWWSEEAKRYLARVFADDRDVRELLVGRSTEVNGPLAQFYRFIAGATATDPQADALVDPSAVPAALVPEDTATWLPIADRGPHAAGILTMPIFLTKYGSRRARAHVVYSAFLCKDFVADTVKLEPSTEPDLTKRPGCSACHQTLEPMAAYFTHVAESDWTWISDAAVGKLKGAYTGAPSHAAAGPRGLGEEVAAAPELAPCVVQNVAQSLLGRALVPEDDAWKTQLVKVFVDGGFRMKALVKAIVTSPRYRAGNDRKGVQ